jgi:polygalacturonase
MKITRSTEPKMSRRHALFAAAGAVVSGGFSECAESDSGWHAAAGIRARIRPPQIPGRDFDVTSYGARGDDNKNSTDGIRAAIDACSKAGGGVVVIPKGDFLTAAIHLRGNIRLHISDGATLRFDRDPKSYLPLVFTRWEGMELMNYSPFLYAFEQTNIAITGGGTVDGNASCEHWWPWKGRTNCGWAKGEPEQQPARDRLEKMAAENVAVRQRQFGTGSFLRPNFIQPYRCTNVLIEGITIKNSPMWEIHPVLCRNVIVRNVSIDSHGPNNDGCDPESSTDVLIENCRFNTGDDCIAIKSGRNHDGRRVHQPSENILIRGCDMKDGHGGVTIGSEISGGVRNVFAEDCRMDSPHLDRILRIKTNSVRGGTIEHIYLRNITAGQVAGPAIEVDFQYEEGDKGQYPPVVRDIEVRTLTCQKSRRALSLRGYASSPVRDVRLIDCRFDNTSQADMIEHVEGLSMKGVKENGKPLDR